MAKQLFNSSEKTNFILNMTEEKYSKIAAFGLVAACFATSVAAAIPVISREPLYEITSAGLTIAGVIAMILALIGALKKFIGKSVLIPCCALGFALVWSLVSLIFSYDKGISFYGFNGRGEGILALIFYFCFFLTGASIKIEKSAKTLIIGLIGVGILNSAAAMVQVFSGKFNDFRMISMEIQANAAVGFSQSPLFLAVLLTFSLIAALSGAILAQKKSHKIVCAAAACLFAFTIMLTYSFVGICGAVISVIAAVIVVFANKKPKINLIAILSVIIPAALSIVIVQAGIIGNISQYRLYDGRILWFADSYYRLSASGEPDLNLVDIDDTFDVYYTLNRKTIDIISANPLAGTGPEQLVFPQLYTSGTAGDDAVINDIIIENKGTFDKDYNEYLYTAATRGIPAAISLIIAVLAILAAGYKSFRSGRKWQSMFVLSVTAAGALIFLICCSSTAFAPIFWCAAGCCCSGTISKNLSS